MYPQPDRLFSESHKAEAESVLRVILNPALLDHFKKLETDNFSDNETDLKKLLIATRTEINCLLNFISYLIIFAGRRGLSRSFLSQIEKTIHPEKVVLETGSILQKIP